MTAPALMDLLAPPAASDRAGAGQGVDAIAAALLQRFRHEAATALPDTPVEALTAEAGDALYAWGVLCYARHAYGDAAALFCAVQRRRPPSLRLWVAVAAAELARGEHARAAQAFARAHELDPTDAAVLFHWAEAEFLMSHTASALRLLEMMGSTSAGAAGRRPELARWSAELRTRIEQR